MGLGSNPANNHKNKRVESKSNSINKYYLVERTPDPVV